MHNFKHTLVRVLFLGCRRLFLKLQVNLLNFFGSNDHVVQVIVGETILSSVLILFFSFQIIDSISRLNSRQRAADVEM